MAAIRLGDETYSLSDHSAHELRERLAAEDDGPIGVSLLQKLDAAAQSGAPAALDPGELALLGVVIETWATEVGTDAADVEALRDAIADELG